MAKTLLLDVNIYNKLEADPGARATLAHAINAGLARVIATPIVVDELRESPFGGLPNWFPIKLEVENVAVVGYWRIGMARLGDGGVYTAHRGQSNKIPDAIIADSADSLADILVSDDHRCRKRLAEITSRCMAMDYQEFLTWVRELVSESDRTIV
jgi:predicted nucleic acid-binding protein